MAALGHAHYFQQQKFLFFFRHSLRSVTATKLVRSPCSITERVILIWITNSPHQTLFIWINNYARASVFIISQHLHGCVPGQFVQKQLGLAVSKMFDYSRCWYIFIASPCLIINHNETTMFKECFQGFRNKYDNNLNKLIAYTIITTSNLFPIILYNTWNNKLLIVNSYWWT